MKRYERMLDLLHCRNGKFIHVKEIIDLSTEPFDCEEGLIDKLKDDDTRDILYGKLENGKVVSIDLGDKINQERAGVGSYDYHKKVLDVILDSWAAYKYGAKAVNFEVHED